ncbi:hypothetical protein IHV25_08590 [Phaeovibrio sulfidiphilus]|uniref:Uncharacterized protein n=1 Tax=Phaeovibrio sulfidiphilus TaxID=1220600 RepID=A0A8J6Z0M5_9PROT|nr:hypothetical protein [Phaeovibrio sulfidiphilus]
MIAEALRALLMPADPVARKLGLVREMVAFESRARRLRRAWAPHREAAHTAILSALSHVPGRGSMAVLGSGLLLEIPLETLARAFGTIILVDAVFPRAVRKRARAAGSVRLVEADLTGVLRAIAAAPGAIPPVPCPAPLPPEALAADLVISANVLSQLPVLPRLHLERAGHADAKIGVFCERLVAAHLHALEGARGDVFFLGDVEREETRTGGACERYDLVYGVCPELEACKTWWWDLAPPGEEGRGLRVRHKVRAGFLRRAGLSDGAGKTGDREDPGPGGCTGRGSVSPEPL